MQSSTVMLIPNMETDSRRLFHASSTRRRKVDSPAAAAVSDAGSPAVSRNTAARSETVNRLNICFMGLPPFRNKQHRALLSSAQIVSLLSETKLKKRGDAAACFAADSIIAEYAPDFQQQTAEKKNF